MFTRLDVVLPFTLRMLFILDLLIYITIYIFIIADTFLISFTCITLWDSRHFCSHNIQFPTWQNQPDTGKMAELKVDNESQAQRGQVGSRTRIHTTGQWHHHSSWTSKSGPGQDWIFYIYICQEINTCCIFHFLTEGSLVILLYSCLAAAFLLSTSGAVNIGAWSLHGGGGRLSSVCSWMSVRDHRRTSRSEASLHVDSQTENIPGSQCPHQQRRLCGYCMRTRSGNVWWIGFALRENQL